MLTSGASWVVKAAYDASARELDIPVYALVYKDRRCVPHVEAVDLSGYPGKAGEEICVQVDDPFEGFQQDDCQMKWAYGRR